MEADAGKRTVMRVITICLLGAAVLAWPGAGQAKDVDPGMEAIARELLRRTTSNAQRASLLYEAATDAKDDKKLQIYLDERALEYALESIHVHSSRTVAIYACQRLRAAVPERRHHWYTVRVDIRRRYYCSPLPAARKRQAGHEFAHYLVYYGQRFEYEKRLDIAVGLYKEAVGIFKALDLPGKNELAIMLARAVRLAEVGPRITALEAQYKKTPKDAELRRKLARVWLIDMNSPPHAAKYIPQTDKAWYTYSRWAYSGAHAVKDPVQARQVGDWYLKQIVPLASPATRRSMLLRAKSYYDRALAPVSKADRKVVPKASRNGLGEADRQAVLAAKEKITAELHGGKKPEWIVIFRSDDPAVWNTDRSTGTLSYAVPLGKIGGPVRYLRLTRQDTGQFVIVPMKAINLCKTIGCTRTYGWQGTKSPVTGGGYRFGIYCVTPATSRSQTVSIMYTYWGWGFGYSRTTKKMVRAWAGRPIPKTAFKIDVTNGDLTPEEAKFLLP